MVLAREEFLEKSGATDLETILTGNQPVRIVMKPRGSSVPLLADRMLEILGSSRRDFERRSGSILQIPAAQIPALLRAGSADLYLEAGPLGHPTVTEATLTSSLRFLPLSPKLLEAFEKDGLPSSPIPPFFKRQPDPIPSVDLGTVLIARADLSDGIAYLITKTLCENQQAMARAHKAWSRFDPAHAAMPSLTGVPLHPGAERYYRERGWLTIGNPPPAGPAAPASAEQ
jgi:TRAP transporter TAXI family solute receptor